MKTLLTHIRFLITKIIVFSLTIFMVLPLTFIEVARSSDDTLVVDAPQDILEGQLFEVKVTNSSGAPIEEAMVVLTPSVIPTPRYTDANGTAFLEAPEVSENTVYTITVEKTGYRPLTQSITVYDSSSQLFITLVSPSIIEGDQFTVTVTTLDNNPIQGASVSVPSYSPYIFITNSMGVAYLTAPYVEHDTAYILVASKEGYLSAETPITVLDTTIPLAQLIITAPSQVYEGESFEVIVTTSGTPIEGAAVSVPSYSSYQFYTNEDGIAYLTAPILDTDTGFTLVATKNGYESAEAAIVVVNRENTSIQLLSPNGGETIEGIFPIEWKIASIEPLLDYSITIQYQYHDSWVTIVNNSQDTIGPYSWNTNEAPDGSQYLLKIILTKNSDIISQDVSDDFFAIDNSIITPGLLYGQVSYQQSGVTLYVEAASVCIILSDVDDIVTSTCTLTDTDGNYDIPVESGTYMIKVNKQGYVEQTLYDIVIEKGKATELSINLEKEANEPSVSSERTAVELMIADQIDNGNIGGAINIANGMKSIQIYNQQLMVSSVEDPEPEKLSFIISAEEGTPGQIIVFKIGPGTLSDLTTIEVFYDNEKLDEVTLQDILNSDGVGPNPKYTGVLTRDTNGEATLFLIVSAPHFSVHEITILGSLLPEEVTSYTSLVALLGCIVIGIATVTMFRKGKKE